MCFSLRKHHIQVSKLKFKDLNAFLWEIFHGDERLVFICVVGWWLVSTTDISNIKIIFMGLKCLSQVSVTNLSCGTLLSIKNVSICV